MVAGSADETGEVSFGLEAEASDSRVRDRDVGTRDAD
jgi:hypothetical protein